MSIVQNFIETWEQLVSIHQSNLQDTLKPFRMLSFFLSLSLSLSLSLFVCMCRLCVCDIFSCP